ncbi:hypothetical protein HKCCE3408_06595 [Rhodobacterales bacterium HKCCE3408]|nr:hypothetical protein [Rhodobacterales bacterium HKCCE3408]
MLLASALSLAPAVAQETDLAGHLGVELNATDPADGACALTFLVTNGLDADIDRAVFEIVLFDTSGTVMQLTLFDFGDLPAGRPRVRQFSVPGISCADIGRVLLNGTTACEGEGIEPDACAATLAPFSRTDIEVIG